MRAFNKLVVTGFILFATYAHAGNGDLVVNGKLGVGITDPANKLHINGGITWGGVNAPYSYSNEDALGLYVEQVGSNDSTSRMRFQSSLNGNVTDYSQFFINPSKGFSFMTLGAGNGNVGIGTATPVFKLDVQGQVASNGTVLTSDAKFKKNLLPILTPLDKVLSMNGLSYEWKTDEYKEKNFPDGRHYGVIAQEVERVLPEVVNTDAKGEKSVAYTEIIPVLIEAIKDQQKMIVQQQKQLNELQQLLRK